MKNGKYLDSLSSDKKTRILKNIASHYRISVTDAENEVRDEDAEMLYEYIANDKSLQMQVYNDMERGKMAKGGNIKVGDMVQLQSGQKAKVLRVEDAFLYVQTSNNRLLDVYTKDVKKMAKGGMTEHGLKIGDKITGRNHGDKIEGYNKEMRETFTTDLDKGKRSSIRYAKGGRTKKAKEPMVVRSYFEDEAIDYAKGGKTMKTKLVDDDYASANAMKEKEIERVRLQFSKNQPKNEFQKSIQTRIEQSILKLAWDGVFAGVKDNNLDIVIKSLFYDFRIIGEDGIYYASHKIENYSQEVIKERNTTYGKGGSILSSNYSIGGL
jgi:preprotein translocase subunit YajC